MTDAKRGGPRPGAGRPSKEPLTEDVHIRMTPDQVAKYKALGGAAWVRRMIDKAKEMLK